MIEKCHFFRKRLGNTGVFSRQNVDITVSIIQQHRSSIMFFCTQGAQAWMWLSPRASSWWPGPVGWICFKYAQA